MKRATRAKAAAARVRLVPAAPGAVAIISDEPIEAIAQRVLGAARAGGASEAEVLMVAFHLGLVDPLFRESVRVQREAAPRVKARQRQIDALAKHNQEKRITDVERKRIQDLNNELKPTVPKKATRYRMIAARLRCGAGRIGYVVDGPRRPKK